MTLSELAFDLVLLLAKLIYPLMLKLSKGDFKDFIRNVGTCAQLLAS